MIGVQNEESCYRGIENEQHPAWWPPSSDVSVIMQRQNVYRAQDGERNDENLSEYIIAWSLFVFFSIFQVTMNVLVPNSGNAEVFGMELATMSNITAADNK